MISKGRVIFYIMKIDKLKVNWTLIVTYILTFALIGSYVYILLHGISPHDACLEYQKYYVENVLEDWPGYGGLDYEIGDVKYFATDHEKNEINTRGAGWGQLESEGCWTVGEEAYFYENIINAEENEKYVVELEIYQTLADKAQVIVNGTEIGEIKSNENGVVSFEIPDNLIKNGFTSFELKIDNPKIPSEISDSTDDRELGVNIVSFKIWKQ